MMNAEDLTVHLKSSKDTKMKHKDTIMFNDYAWTCFLIGMLYETYQGKYTNAFNPNFHNDERIPGDLNACNKDPNEK